MKRRLANIDWFMTGLLIATAVMFVLGFIGLMLSSKSNEDCIRSGKTIITTSTGDLCVPVKQSNR